MPLFLFGGENLSLPKLLTRSEIETALDKGDFKVLAWSAVMALALRVI